MKSLIVFVVISINSVLNCQIFTEINTGFPDICFSSVDWGDYDNDGDLDLLMVGDTDSCSVSLIFRNDNNVFADINAKLAGMMSNYDSSHWADLDNDGDLDIMLTGYDIRDSKDTLYYLTKIYRNDTQEFTEIHTSLKNVAFSSADLADYDNDGDLDILLTGYYWDYEINESCIISKIYRNDKDFNFTEIDAGLKGVHLGVSIWYDYNNDGKSDILLTGEGGYDPEDYTITKLYKNEGNDLFTEVQTGLVDVRVGDISSGDYDNDGDLDLILTGIEYTDNTWYDRTKIYRNDDNGIFTEVTHQIPDMTHTSIDGGDYDNDGDLDLLITGYVSDHGQISESKIYNNNGNWQFEEATSFIGLQLGDSKFVDYDNDGDLDVFITGSFKNGIIGTKITKLYRNDTPQKNSPPSKPMNLFAEVNGNNIVFTWDKATDEQTPQNSLFYNIYLGCTPNGIDFVSPMSNIYTGYREIISVNNVSQNNYKILKDVPQGTYYWSVQSLDQGLMGSEFAPEQTFNVTGIDESPIPLTSELYQNYPNPFNPVTEINFSLNRKEHVNLSVFNSKGELVQTLFNGMKPMGMHSVKFDASELSSETYFYKLTTENGTETRKMLLLR